jgi:hypothetical protein
MRIKLIGKRSAIAAIDDELTCTRHVHEFDASQSAFGHPSRLVDRRNFHFGTLMSFRERGDHSISLGEEPPFSSGGCTADLESEQTILQIKTTKLSAESCPWFISKIWYCFHKE